MAAKHLVTIASYWHSFEAEHAKLRLEAEGIRAFVQGDYFVDTFGGLTGNVSRGIKVDVSADDAERAVEILQLRDGGVEPGSADEMLTTDREETREDDDSDTF